MHPKHLLYILSAVRFTWAAAVPACRSQRISCYQTDLQDEEDQRLEVYQRGEKDQGGIKTVYSIELVTPEVVAATVYTAVSKTTIVKNPVTTDKTVGVTATSNSPLTATATKGITAYITKIQPVHTTSTLAPVTVTKMVGTTAWETSSQSAYTTRKVPLTMSTVVKPAYVTTQTVTAIVSTEVTVPFRISVTEGQGRLYVRSWIYDESVVLVQQESEASEFHLRLDGTITIGDKMLSRSSNQGIQAVRAIPGDIMKTPMVRKPIRK
ncbi:hypothetical protein B0I35DRAFT_413827 [Stachybotrys elegans]|uniref:Uncharacterized protein n=1 Tax=Stachybotrys elegans TaxID=80388 RepID=A0A8K0SJ08_9HYPO|nr:hypothetical protein B0I35DRAFT_413827 [Stachybotrys elegans]